MRHCDTVVGDSSVRLCALSVCMIDWQAIRRRWEADGSKRDERGRRLFAASEARAAGWGGLAAVSSVTGLARSTIGRGLKDLDAPPLAPGQVRREGGGPRSLSETDATLLDDLKRPATLGDPARPLLWVSKSLDKLASAQGGRKRPLDRYAASQRLSPDSDEAQVLDAMLAARFVLIRVERRHPEAGLIVSDLIREEEFWLVDEGMESTAPIGFKMATRVYSPEDFHMAAGVFVPLEGVLLTSAVARRPLLARMDLDEAVEDRRFAEAIYREAVRAGVMERVRFQDPSGLAGAAA